MTNQVKPAQPAAMKATEPSQTLLSFIPSRPRQRVITILRRYPRFHGKSVNLSQLQVAYREAMKEVR